MFYAPHILQKKVTEETRDSLNRVVSVSEQWVEVCPCRCDDNSTAKVKDDAGNDYVYSYHIVCSRADIKAGDEVRVMSGESIRGEGTVVRVIRTNYLDYMSVYV